MQHVVAVDFRKRSICRNLSDSNRYTFLEFSSNLLLHLLLAVQGTQKNQLQINKDRLIPIRFCTPAGLSTPTSSTETNMGKAYCMMRTNNNQNVQHVKLLQLI